MASPKNYKRRQDQEDQKILYMWMNTKTYQNLIVIKNLAGTYDVEYSESDIRTDISSKEKARKIAVQWAKDHPYGPLMSFDRFKQGNVKPGTATKYKNLYLVSMGTRGSNFGSGAPSGDARVYKNGRQVDVVSATRLGQKGELEEFLERYT